jgi:hypothetical protein
VGARGGPVRFRRIDGCKALTIQMNVGCRGTDGVDEYWVFASRVDGSRKLRWSR